MPRGYIRTGFLLAPLSWAGLIFYLSSQPSIETPALFPGQDKLFHLIAFGILGFFAMGSRQASHEGYPTRQVWQVALVVMLYGILDEFHQYFVPGRSADVYDVLADAIGGLLGVWAMYWLARVLYRRSLELSG
jgi:VanZ family protein